MSRKRSNPNKNFMILNGVLVFAVFIVVLPFLYIAFKFKRDAEKIITYEGKYEIALSKDFAGQSLSIYVNDSLLLNQVMPDSVLHLSVDKFAEESVLMIVDNNTDNTTPFNLNPEGSKVTVKNTQGIISIIEQQ
jgi:hypothetical protein